MKKLFFCLATCGLIFANCSRDEITDVNSSDPDVIKFTSTMTRATVVDLNGLKGATNGFVVYATNGASPSGWYTGVDGTNNYKFTSGAWGWANSATAPRWPIVTTGYPMSFYAYFASKDTGLDKQAFAYDALSFGYEIQPVADQIDLLAAKNVNVATKPGDGYLPLTFNHILTKVNFGIVPGYKATVHVQQLGVESIKESGTYGFTSDSWTATSGSASYDYFNKTGADIKAITGADATESASEDLYTDQTDKHLMLMTQSSTTATWIYDQGADLPPSDAYISAIYRIETPNDDNAIGYADAQKHPGIKASNGWAGVTAPVTYNGGLFVKVGFPFGATPTSLTWEKGKGYKYNIYLGTANSSNGYLADEYYYDENGEQTDLLITPAKEQGEPMTDGIINFKVSVSNWDNEADTVVK